MMVVDASVWVSRLVPHDAHHATSRQWLERRLMEGALLIAPVLVLAEVAGALSRQTGWPELAHRAVDGLSGLAGLRLVSVDTRLGQAAAQLAADLQLRGANAIYVATASLLSVPLVTWDSEQRRRAGRLIEVRVPGQTVPS